jgi:hypothetical protein
MHCEKNLCKNIVRTIIGETYHSRGRKDMEEMGIREELWLRLHRGNLGIFTKPHPSYVLTPAEREEVLEIICGLRTPIDYAGSIHSYVSDGSLRFMKSHDYHVLMQ